MLSSLGLGLLVLTVSQTQIQAMQLALFVTLPSIILSGFMFAAFGLPVFGLSANRFHKTLDWPRTTTILMVCGIITPSVGTGRVLGLVENISWPPQLSGGCKLRLRTA